MAIGIRTNTPKAADFIESSNRVIFSSCQKRFDKILKVFGSSATVS